MSRKVTRGYIEVLNIFFCIEEGKVLVFIIKHEHGFFFSLDHVPHLHHQITDARAA